MSGLRYRLARAQGNADAQARLLGRFSLGGGAGPSLEGWTTPADWGADLKHWWDGEDSANLFALQDKSAMASPNGSLRTWTDRVGGEDLILDTAGGTTSPKRRVSGAKIQGADFNGSTDRVLLTSAALSATDGLLVLVEARTSTATVDPIHNNGTLIRYHTDGDWEAISGNGSPRSGPGDGSLTDPKTVAVSFGSSGVEIWVDKTPTTDSTTNTAPTTDRFTIGGRGSDRFDGVIGQLCLLDRALTQEDVNLFHEWTRGLIT